ncbi:hypothetical protein EST38_g14698, partial [Candolleomyces aberdarensis]
MPQQQIPNPSKSKTTAESGLFDSEGFQSFPCPTCGLVCKSKGGRTQHIQSAHPVLSSDSEGNEFLKTKIFRHSKLTGQIVNSSGIPLPPGSRPPPVPNAPNAWHPFSNRLEYDFAYYHYIQLETSKSKINIALDHWKAATIAALGSSFDPESSESAPWRNAEELYATIDSIQAGGAPFITVYLRYNGPKPSVNPPSWMTATYELCIRNSRLVLEQQLQNPEFATQFETSPYQQFNSSGDRIFSNLMSGDWVWRTADEIANDASTHGSMVVPIVSGLDKTTVSVATGHQEYHPFYMSAGNLTNLARRSHGNGVVPVGFLPIPKVSKRQKKKKEYKTFARQLYHTCLQLIFEPLRRGMTTPEILRCPDGHYRRCIFNIGPVIADYPEQ